jgi:hypothetical protein
MIWDVRQLLDGMECGVAFQSNAYEEDISVYLSEL